MRNSPEVSFKGEGTLMFVSFLLADWNEDMMAVALTAVLFLEEEVCAKNGRETNRIMGP